MTPAQRKLLEQITNGRELIRIITAHKREYWCLIPDKELVNIRTVQALRKLNLIKQRGQPRRRPNYSETVFNPTTVDEPPL